MDLLEHSGKQLLRDYGITTPTGVVVDTAAQAAEALDVVGVDVILKCQVPTGKRGKSGGIAFARSTEEATHEAERLLTMRLAGHLVESVLIEERMEIAREMYAAILNDASGKQPLMIFSMDGGMDIEEVSETAPERVKRLLLDIRDEVTDDHLATLLSEADLDEEQRARVASVLSRLYDLYRGVDAELVEVNPLVLTTSGDVVALDAKVTVDPGAVARHGDLLGRVGASRDTAHESERVRTAKELGLSLIELDGSVGVLANGAGLTMTTLDAVHYFGGRAANFLEIGGDGYTKALPALEIVLANPAVRSVVVNFCGAFARTDVMAEGVVKAIQELEPDVPFFFSIHGTGEREAIATVREGLGLDPFDRMDDAVKAAVDAARRDEEVASC